MPTASPGATGLSVPLRVSFIGLKALKWVALAHNNLAPRLVLFDDHLVQRVVFSRSRKYSGIEQVEVSTTDTDNIEIAYAGTPSTFSCKLKSAQDLAGVLRFFAGKGVPLGERARRRVAAMAA